MYDLLAMELHERLPKQYRWLLLPLAASRNLKVQPHCCKTPLLKTTHTSDTGIKVELSWKALLQRQAHLVSKSTTQAAKGEKLFILQPTCTGTRTTSPRLGEGGYVPQGQSEMLVSTISLFCSDPLCAGWYCCFYQSNAEIFPEAIQRHQGITLHQLPGYQSSCHMKWTIIRPRDPSFTCI